MSSRISYVTRLALVEEEIRQLGGFLPSNTLGMPPRARLHAIEHAMRDIRDRHSPQRDILPRDILAAVSTEFGVSIVDIRSARRQRYIVIPRQAAMWLMRCHTRHSLPTIAHLLDRDHSTVIHGLHEHHRRMNADPAFSARMVNLSSRVAQLPYAAARPDIGSRAVARPQTMENHHHG